MVPKEEREFIFFIGNYSKRTKTNFNTHKTISLGFDGTWSLSKLDLINAGPKLRSACRKHLVVIDKLSKIGMTAPLKNAQFISTHLKSC